MKYNLENAWVHHPEDCVCNPCKWKRGFKAELREIEGIWKTYFGKDADALVPIKEILGK